MATAEVSEVSDGSEWQVGKSITDGLLYMLEQEVDCDFTFSVTFEDDPPQQISAHKLLLKAGSPVFQKMFSGSLLDSDVVNVSDMKATTLKETFRYMYGEKVIVTGSNVLKLLYSANKYKLQLLADKCGAYLAASIAHNNVCPILTDALVYKNEDLVHKCLYFISKNTQNVLADEGFLKLSHAALWKFVQEPQLPADQESKLYERCVEWAKHQGAKTDKEIRSLLGDCINHICFLTLTPTDFTRIAGLSEVLTDKERAHILSYLTNKDRRHIERLTGMGINTNSRINSVQRMYNYGTHTDQSQTATDVFTLQSNKLVVLSGLSMCNSGVKNSETNVTVKVTLGGEENKCIAETTNKLVSDGSANPMNVLFTPPVELQPGSQYTVEVQCNFEQTVAGYCNNFLYGNAFGSISFGDVSISSNIQKYAVPGYAGTFVHSLLFRNRF